ncbi:MAG: shikimate kinase [Gemmatimonadaceae bacterium]
MPAAKSPTLLFVIGPPAVGKMTVGAEIARRTGLRLLHNHQTVDLVLPYFEFGSPRFSRLVREFRTRILEEVAASDLPGLIFTFVQAFDHASDAAALESWAKIFLERGGSVFYLELEATREERLRRNETPERLAVKPFKRDLAKSREQLLDLDAKYQLNSRGEFDARPDYLRLDTTTMSPEEVATRAIERFGLKTNTAPSAA